ncbi:MAG: hypothetical protein ACI4E1_02800 [Lachnospira sp.]
MKTSKMSRNNSGSITLEACIVLTLFIFFVLTLYSFFMVFEIQGKISTTLLQCSQSLSLDSFNIDKTYVDFDEDEELDAFPYLVDKLGMQKSIINEKNVTRNNQWYKEPSSASENSELQRVIKDRFIAYLTAEGTDSAAKDLLEQFRIEDGISGLDFSESKIDDNNNLVIKVKYRVNYVFDCPTIGLEPLQFGQSTTSHLWREKKAIYKAHNETSGAGSSGGGRS